MSKEFQQREKEKNGEKREKNESQQQQQNISITSSSFVEQPINFSTKMTTTTTPIASENEESLITTVIDTSTTITGLQQPLNQILQHKKSLSNSNNSTSFSMIVHELMMKVSFKFQILIYFFRSNFYFG